MEMEQICVCILCISDTVDEDDDLYDFVEDEENIGDEIYEDLMRTDEQPEIVSQKTCLSMSSAVAQIDKLFCLFSPGYI